jgi:hypothetical protein
MRTNGVVRKISSFRNVKTLTVITDLSKNLKMRAPQFKIEAFTLDSRSCRKRRLREIHRLKPQALLLCHADTASATTRLKNFSNILVLGAGDRQRDRLYHRFRSGHG